jgi:F1F0 ATPase subunit 2
MTMNELPFLFLSGAAGAVLGVLFFAGLWFTVRRGLVSERPALWFLGSTLVRTGGLLAAFYLIARGNWHYLLACLLGFFASRMGMALVVRRKEKRCA